MSIKKTKISVIVPVFNTAKLLPKCIDSILEQTWTNIEIILVDDGSTDNSAEILRSYAKKNPEQIKTIFKNNSGQASARNMALNIMNGEYVSFVDSDDWITPNMLQSLLDCAIATNSDIVTCDFQTVDEHDEITGSYSSGAVALSGQTIQEDQGIIFSLIPQVTGKLFDSALFSKGKNRFPENIWYEDLALLPVIMMKAKRIAKVAEYYYKYFKREGSTTTSFNLKVLDSLKALEFIDIAIENSESKIEYKRLVLEVKVRTIYMTAVRLSNIQDKNERNKGYKVLTKYFRDLIPEPYKYNTFTARNRTEKMVLMLIYRDISFLLYYFKTIKSFFKQ